MVEPLPVNPSRTGSGISCVTPSWAHAPSPILVSHLTDHTHSPPGYGMYLRFIGC